MDQLVVYFLPRALAIQHQGRANVKNSLSRNLHFDNFLPTLDHDTKTAEKATCYI
jgi:hypothetical protein